MIFSDDYLVLGGVESTAIRQPTKSLNLNSGTKLKTINNHGLKWSYGEEDEMKLWRGG